MRIVSRLTVLVIILAGSAAAQTRVDIDGQTYMCYGVAPDWTRCVGKNGVTVVPRTKPTISDALGKLAEQLKKNAEAQAAQQPSSQPPALDPSKSYATLGVANGWLWQSLSELERLLYLRGITDALTTGGEQERPGSALCTSCNPADVSREITAFYSGPEKFKTLPVPIVAALSVAKIKGTDANVLVDRAEKLLSFIEAALHH